MQHAVRQAAAKTGIPKRVYSFASHLLLANYDIHTIERLLGHTMFYIQTVPSVTLKEAKSPLDLGVSLAHTP